MAKPNTQNWQRSYDIRIGTTVRSPEEGSFLASSIVSTETIKEAGGIIDSNGITIPSNALQISNIASDGWDERGHTFRLETTRGVSQSSGGGSEKTTLELYNINAAFEDIINQKNCVVRVFAGYGEKVDLIYAGDVMAVTPKTVGRDKVYTLRCVDGGDTATDVIGTADYDESMSDADVIRDMAGRFPDASVVDYGLGPLENTNTTGGYSCMGTLYNNFDRMLKRNNLQNVRYNGKIVLLPYRWSDLYEREQVTNYILSADLIKDISSTSSNGDKSSEDTKSKQGIVVNTNLIPIEAGQFFTIPDTVSDTYKGTYLAKGVKVKLESHGQMWDVAITGEIIS